MSTIQSRKSHRGVLFSLLFAALWAPFIPSSNDASLVTATVETVPVPHELDAADDAAIWIHPSDPSQSTIIGTDKQGALEVYDLTGARLQSIPIATNNVDLRYNFPLGGERVALVTTFDKTKNRLGAFKVNPESRLLEDVVDSAGAKVRRGGIAMYHSPITGKYYYLSNYAGMLRQFELLDNGSGKVRAELVRMVKYGSGQTETEGVVADDILARIYVSDEVNAIYRIGAEPDAGPAKTIVDVPIARGGHFEPDVEGLTIYYKSDGTGYLFASSQKNNTYVAYTREGKNVFLGTITIGDGIVDGVTYTDGIDVTNLPLGPAFPTGMFVVQDDKNGDGSVRQNQNFKLVPFESIAAALNLTVDTTWDPRLIGAPVPVTAAASP